jgi:hypothetical protein
MASVNICFEHNELGGMGVLRVCPRSMAEEDWIRVTWTMDMYAWRLSVGGLREQIQAVIGDKGWVHLDQNLAWMDGEEANETYMDFNRSNTEITYYTE